MYVFGGKLKVIFIAGPFDSPDPFVNVNNAIHVATDLFDRRVCVPLVPHLSALWHVVTPRERSWWLELAKGYIRVCDGLYRIEGASEGSDGEVIEAKQVGIPVFTDIRPLEIFCGYDLYNLTEESHCT